jgi:hypothetical protein
MAQCEFCSSPVDPATNTCTSCSAAQSTAPASAAAVAPAAAPAAAASSPAAGGTQEYTSYDQVPWFRKNWFAILTALLFPLATLGVVATGDVFYVSKGELRKYTKAAKIFIGLWCCAHIVRALST